MTSCLCYGYIAFVLCLETYFKLIKMAWFSGWNTRCYWHCWGYAYVVPAGSCL